MLSQQSFGLLDSHTSEKPEHVQTSYKQFCKSLSMQHSAADAASVQMQSCPTTNRQGLWEGTSDSPAIRKLHVDMALQQDLKQVHILPGEGLSLTSPHQLSHTCCYFCNPALSFAVLCPVLTCPQHAQATAWTQDHVALRTVRVFLSCCQGFTSYVHCRMADIHGMLWHAAWQLTQADCVRHLCSLI